jgi:hypothetical protein
MPRRIHSNVVHRAVAVLALSTLLGFSVSGCGSPMRRVTTPASMPVAPDTASTGVVPLGTQVPIRVVQAISSRDADSTEPVTRREQGFIVAADVRGKAGAILIANGTMVQLNDAPSRFTGRKRLGGVIAGSILLFPIGLLFLLLQGGDVTLESGSGLTAVVVG